MKKNLIVIASVLMIAFTVSTAQAQKETIVSLAAGNENLSTLVAAVKAAGLVETLSADGPYTVFAPTNETFEA